MAIDTLYDLRLAWPVIRGGRRMKVAFVGTFPAKATGPMSGPRRVCINLARSMLAVAEETTIDIFAYGEVGLGLFRKVFGGCRDSERWEMPVKTVGYLVLPFHLRKYDLVYFAGGPFHAILTLAFRGFGSFPKVVYCAHGVIRQERKLHA